MSQSEWIRSFPACEQEWAETFRKCRLPLQLQTESDRWKTDDLSHLLISPNDSNNIHTHAMSLLPADDVRWPTIESILTLVGYIYSWNACKAAFGGLQLKNFLGKISLKSRYNFCFRSCWLLTTLNVPAGINWLSYSHVGQLGRACFKMSVLFKLPQWSVVL